MIVDCFPFFKELDILEIRLNILNAYVDKFILIEWEETFTGIDKQLYFKENKKRFEPFLNKIEYLKVVKIPNHLDSNKGEVNWQREFYQKNSMMNLIYQLNENDTLIISDCDEIPDLSKINFSAIETPQVFLNKNFTLRLNLMTFNNNQTFKRIENTDKIIGNPWMWFGSTILKQKYIKNQNFWGWSNLREQRQNLPQIQGGWHFSSCMPNEDIISKIRSYSHYTEYSNINDKKIIEEYIKLNKDFVNYDMRDIKQISISEDNLPKYIIENKKKYNHLFK